MKKAERGQTIVLVAVALVGLLGMAALAIDVTVLYVTKGELQRAADATALAGAKAFVDSGYTSDPTRQTLAQDMAAEFVNKALLQNKVAGQVPGLTSSSPDFTKPGNPTISITLERSNMPTFFARIWGNQNIGVSATAVAEAYNPSFAPANSPPIAPKCVKPLLVVNVPPDQFINPATFVPKAGLIGAHKILHPCGVGSCAADTFRPAVVDAASPKYCPKCQGGTDPDLVNGIQCCDTTPYACGVATLAKPVMALAGPALDAQVDNGARCLIDNPLQDTIDLTGLVAGTGPALITPQTGPLAGQNVNTSRSITALPIVDSPSASSVHVIGFLQVFVEQSTPGNLTVDIMNVVGCGSADSAAPPILGGGYSAIPVRLIH